MARKSDPIVPVIRFFQTASMEQCDQALAAGREIMRGRFPSVARVKQVAGPPRRRRKVADGAGLVAQVG